MAPPVVIIILMQVLKAALSSSNIELSDDVLYSSALALYAGFLGIKNWFKNGHKKSGIVGTPDPDQVKQKDAGK